MGIALYERPRDGAVFAIVAPKTGGATNYLWQYRLEDQRGTVAGTLVRRFGAFSRVGSDPSAIGEIEAVVVDDALGFVYYATSASASTSGRPIPIIADAAKELAVLGRDGYRGDREGLAIYHAADGARVPGVERSGAGDDAPDDLSRAAVRPATPHHAAACSPRSRRARTRPTASRSPSRSLPGFPAGMLVMMNSSPRNFLIYDWKDVAARLARPKTGR